MDNNNFGKVLKKYRLKAGLKQIEVAKLIGVPQSVISDYENNKINPRIESFVNINYLFMKIYDFEEVKNDFMSSIFPGYIK